MTGTPGPGHHGSGCSISGADRAWWLDWSSKPACLAKTRAGGFDSHTLPPVVLWSGLQQLCDCVYNVLSHDSEESGNDSGILPALTIAGLGAALWASTLAMASASSLFDKAELFVRAGCPTCEVVISEFPPGRLSLLDALDSVNRSELAKWQRSISGGGTPSPRCC